MQQVSNVKTSHMASLNIESHDGIFNGGTQAYFKATKMIPTENTCILFKYVQMDGY